MQVHIESSMFPLGTTITDMSGQQIKGATAVDIHIAMDRANRAVVTLFTSEVDVKAETEFQMIHPFTGTMKTIDSIKFTDGTTWSAE